MFKNKALILAKIESVYGTDPTPTTAANAILCDLPEIDFVFRKLDRLNVKPFLGNRAAVNVGEALKIKFATEVKGSGDSTPDTPPEIGVLFKGCNMTETVDMDTGAISVTFASTGKTITRSTGSFVTDGFVVGDVITTDSVSNPGPFTVTNVAALVLTVSESVSDEGPTSYTITGKRVTYTPDDDIDGSSITIYFWQDGHKYVLSGCRGTFTIEGKAGEYGKITWEFTGLYDGPADDTIPTDAVFNSGVPPILKSGLFTLGSYAGTIENFKLTYGNEIAKRPDVNAATGFLAQFAKDRNVTAEIDPEAPALSSFDPLGAVEAGTDYTMSITFGSTAGNRMRVYTPKVNLDAPKYADRENILTYGIPLIVCPSAGEDDVSIIFN